MMVYMKEIKYLSVNISDDLQLSSHVRGLTSVILRDACRFLCKYHT